VAREKKPTFNSLREALSLPAPSRGGSFEEYPHQEFSRFKVRVHPPDAEGRILRQWAIRVKYTLNGKEKEDRPTFGQLEAFDKTEVAVPYQEGLRRALGRLKEIELLKASPELAAEEAKKAQRVTVGRAWAQIQLEASTQREATTVKEESQYRTYLKHLEDSYLDELDYSFWSAFTLNLHKARALNADGMTWRQLDGPQKRAVATVAGITTLAAKLYTTGHLLDGLPGKDKSWIPPLQNKKKLVGKPNVRTHHIPLKKLAEVWRAADVMCESWARDQLRLYILSGLRFSLNANLQFVEVQTAFKRLAIDPRKPGTKRRKASIAENAPDILIPLSNTALQIIEARRAWAPDPNGPVWYAVRTPGGKAAKNGAPQVPKHADPRSNWSRIAENVLEGFEFLRHDLRRTFAQLGLQSGADLVGVSLLMLHAPRTLATLMGVADITVEYMNTALAQKRMRSAADSIEKYVLGLLDGSITPDDDMELPPELEAAVGSAGDDDAADNE
jgi:integrase